MLNIALIGYGYWGPNVARNIHNNPNLNLHVICDLRTERLNKARELYLEQTSYTSDTASVISDPKIDAVAIAVETSGHYGLVKQALLNGKHVYVEKPFTDNVKQAEELKLLAEEKKLTIHVDHIMVHHPAIKLIQDYILSGKIGDIHYIDASRMNLGQIKMDVSAMWDLAIHDLSIIDTFMQGIDNPKISAVGEKRYSTTETLTFVTFKKDNFVAHIKSSWISPLKERRMIIAGSKKMIVFDDIKIDDKVMIYDKGVDIISDGQEYDDYAVRVRQGDILVPLIPTGDALYNSIEHFRQCISNGEQSITGPGQAIRLQKILEEADIQMRKFGEVEV